MSTDVRLSAAAIMEALRRGEVEEAERALRSVLAARPDSPLALTLLARIQRQRGEYQKAFATLRRAREASRGYPPMLSEAGALASAMGKYQMAVRWYRRLVRALPDQPDGYASLALAHQNTGNLPGALRNYRRALERGAHNDDHLRQQMARLLLMQGHADEAAEIYEQLAVTHPDDLAPLYALADARIVQGRFDEAVELYREVLRRRPGLTEVHQRIADARQFDDAEDRDIEAMRSAEPRTPLQREQLAFALGKALDDCGRHDEAFDKFREANDLQRARGTSFDFDTFGAMVDEIVEFFDEDWFGGTLKPGRLRAQPIFIVGMPCAGTALVEQVLASHELVSPGGEQTFFTLLAARALYPDVERLTRRMRDIPRWRDGYIGTLIRAAGKADFITDSFPGNFVHLGIIRTLFPGAPVIHCRRDPLDNSLAVYCHDFRGANGYATDFEDIGRYRLLYDRLMRHWDRVLPGPVHTIDYEDLTQDPPLGIGALLDYCELPPSDACIDFHKASPGGASRNSWQVRQPIYRHSVGRWHFYERQLEPLREALAGEQRNPA